MCVYTNYLLLVPRIWQNITISLLVSDLIYSLDLSTEYMQCFDKGNQLVPPVVGIRIFTFHDENFTILWNHYPVSITEK